MRTKSRLTNAGLQSRVEQAAGGIGTPAWCIRHGDMGWLYDDESGSCLWTHVVEDTSEDCEFIPVKLTVDRSSDRRGTDS